MASHLGSACRGLLTPIDARNLRIFSAWIVASTASVAGTLLLTGEGGLVQRPLAWCLVAVSGALTIQALRAYLQFIRHADELLRKIQLEALGMGFGAGMVFMLCYRLLERLGAYRLPISAPFVVMALFWAVGQYLGLRRYLPTEDA